MGKTRGVHETTPELRNRMVGMYEAGLGLREIAAAVSCSQRTVKRWLNRFEKEGNVDTKERCGRKRATTSEQDEAIVRLATHTQITAAKAVLPALGLSCSVDTIRERLHKAGIHNWSPSRKHIQKIPLGGNDSAALQHAVWRPTGTHLGKKKSSKCTEKLEKTDTVAIKKRTLSKKLKPRNRQLDLSEPPIESLKLSEQIDPSYTFSTAQNHSQLQQEQQQSSVQPPLSETAILNNEIPQTSLLDTQSNYNNDLNLVDSPETMYQHHHHSHQPHHSNLDITQNWSLDLGQVSSHHYSSNQPADGIIHEHQQNQQNHLQRLETRQDQRQHHDYEKKMCNLHEHNHSVQHFFVEEPHRISQVQPPQLHEQLQTMDIQAPQEIAKITRSNSCASSSTSTETMSLDLNNELNKDSSETSSETKSNDDHLKQSDNKKKGGKAKGTLETSVEIRNRMIGMSEAGLSTLSIALAINRSERTVKRWLERWNKEGNVLTKERKGRRRITTKEQDEAIVKMATQHPLTAAKHVAPALGLNCSVDTIRERLHKAGIHSWKLGKKQGEGNTIHTLHLWQASGNRTNKLKLYNEKKRKAIYKKSGQSANKRKISKKDTDEASKTSPVIQTENALPEQLNTVHYNSSAAMSNYPTTPNMIQPIHMSTTQPLVPITTISQLPSAPQSIQQSLVPILQQRPDCRMITPIPSQTNPIVSYSSCMIGNNNPMDQPEITNYEPFIWTF